MERPSYSTWSRKFCTWVQPQKQQNYLGSLSKQTIQHHSQCVIISSLWLNHSCKRSWSWLVSWSPINLPELTPKKGVLFIIGYWNAKVGDQEIPRIMRSLALVYKMKQGKANWILSKEHAGHSKHPFPAMQETTLHMDITRWTILKSYWLYSLQLKMEKMFTVSKNKTSSWLWFTSWALY